MKKRYVDVSFQSFLRHRLNEGVKLKTKEEEEPIENEEEEGEEPTPEPIERKNSKKKVDTIDEIVNDYKKLREEFDKIFEDWYRRNDVWY